MCDTVATVVCCYCCSCCYCCRSISISILLFLFFTSVPQFVCFFVFILLLLVLVLLLLLLLVLVLVLVLVLFIYYHFIIVLGVIVLVWSTFVFCSSGPFHPPENRKNAPISKPGAFSFTFSESHMRSSKHYPNIAFGIVNNDYFQLLHFEPRETVYMWNFGSIK